MSATRGNETTERRWSATRMPIETKAANEPGEFIVLKTRKPNGIG